MKEPQAVGRLLKRVQYHNHRAMDRALAGIETTLVQWDALRVISEQPNSPAHALAVASFQSDQSFGTLAVRLENQGLIRRTRGKGRVVEHRLTASGEKMLIAGAAVARKVAAHAFSALSQAELAKLYELLLRVSETANARGD
ncbi:MAG: MarR family transcriptional regulator [Myxococcaceae bacterium]|nr:MarR family transcriptional regulator [Myxococcaceae bacterium]